MVGFRHKDVERRWGEEVPKILGMPDVEVDYGGVLGSFVRYHSKRPTSPGFVLGALTQQKGWSRLALTAGQRDYLCVELGTLVPIRRDL